MNNTQQAGLEILTHSCARSIHASDIQHLRFNAYDVIRVWDYDGELGHFSATVSKVELERFGCTWKYFIEFLEAHGAKERGIPDSFTDA